MSLPYTFICKFKVFKYTSSQQNMSDNDSSGMSDGDEIFLRELKIDDLQQDDITSCGIYAGFVYPLLLGRFGEHVIIKGQQTRVKDASINFIYQAAFAIAHLVYVQGFHKILDNNGRINLGVKKSRDEEENMTETRIELEMLHEDAEDVHKNSLLIDVTLDSLVLMEPINKGKPFFKYKDFRKSLWTEKELPGPVKTLGSKLFLRLQNLYCLNFFVMDMASIFAPLFQFSDDTYCTYNNKNISFLADHIEQSEGGMQQNTRLEVLRKVALAQYFQTFLNLNGKNSDSFVFFIHYMPNHYGLNVITLKSLEVTYKGHILYPNLPSLNDLECKIYDSLSTRETLSQNDYGATITRLASLHILNDARIWSEIKRSNTIADFLKALQFRRGSVEVKKKGELDLLIEQCCSYMQTNKQEEVQFVVYALNILREKIRSGWAEFPRSSNDMPNDFEAFKRGIKKAVKEYILIIMPTLLYKKIITVGNVIIVDDTHRNIDVSIYFEEGPWMLLAGWDQNWNFDPERKIFQNVRYSLVDTTVLEDNRITKPNLQGRADIVDDGNTRKSIARTRRKGIRLGGVDFIINSCKGVRGGNTGEIQYCQNFEDSMVTSVAGEHAYGKDFACYHNYIALVAIQNAVDKNLIQLKILTEAKKKAPQPTRLDFKRKLNFKKNPKKKVLQPLDLTKRLESFLATVFFGVLYGFVSRYGTNILQKGIGINYRKAQRERKNGNDFLDITIIKNRLTNLQKRLTKLQEEDRLTKRYREKILVQEIINTLIVKNRSFSALSSGDWDYVERNFRAEDLNALQFKVFYSTGVIIYNARTSDKDFVKHFKIQDKQEKHETYDIICIIEDIVDDDDNNDTAFKSKYININI